MSGGLILAVKDKKSKFLIFKKKEVFHPATNRQFISSNILVIIHADMNFIVHVFVIRKIMERTQLKDVQEEIKEAANEAGTLINKKQMTLAVAESVTSGNIQAAFSLATDSTTFFQGGITSYNIGQKCRHLLVEPTHAIASNCVSKNVSEQMAQQTCFPVSF